MIIIHYIELEVLGAYCPKRDDMVEALLFCARQQQNLMMLI
jgi:hypothetical protein